MKKRKEHSDLLSGSLASPYGYMVVGKERFKNGHPVKGGVLLGAKEHHSVPIHWIERKTTYAP